MTRTIEDIYSYQKQALDLLDKDHPHYDEIKILLTEQINAELSEYYMHKNYANTKANRGTSPT